MKALLTFRLLLISLVALSLATSCDNDTAGIGQSVIPRQDSLSVSQALYSVQTSTIKADSVLANATTGYLGRVIDPETNSMTTCNFIAQYGIVENYRLPAKANIVKSSSGAIEADSVILQLNFMSYYGDSLTTMRIGAYQLDTNNVMSETEKYYSNFDASQFIDNSSTAIKREVSYTIRDLARPDTLWTNSKYYKTVRIKLPTAYGSFIMNQYYEHPEYFANSYQFIRHVCPGFYFKVLDGVGAMINIDYSALHLYFRYTYTNTNNNDTTVTGVATMAATQEVLQNTNTEQSNIDHLLNGSDYTMLKSPAGLFTEVTLPVEAVLAEHANDSINGASISFPRIYNDSQNAYNLATPTHLLMVRKAEMYTFFEQEKLADGLTSYLTTYSSANNAYTYANISSLISAIREDRDQGAGILATDDDATKATKYAAYATTNPDWNKVVLIPVDARYKSDTSSGSTSYTLMQIRNTAKISSTKLLKGDGNDQVRLSVIYSRFEK